MIWYTHNQANHLVGRLLVFLTGKGFPCPTAEEAETLVEALVAQTKGIQSEDWRAVFAPNSFGLTGMLLSANALGFMCENNTRLDTVATALLRAELDSVKLPVEYDDVDKVQYLLGLIYTWRYVYAANHTIRWASASLRTVDELKQECLTRYAKGNKAWRDAVEASFGHLLFAFQRAGGEMARIGSMPMRYFTERMLVEAFAADKPKDFDMQAFLHDFYLS